MNKHFNVSIKELNRELSSLLEEYEVYSPSEESSEENVHRSKFDSKGIRNIMMSYFMGNEVQDVYNNIRNHIDKMSDEWVIEFLKNQGDTQVNKISEDLSNEIQDLDNFENLYDKYVPSVGNANTVGGELLRAVGRIEYRYYNDGDILNIGYGKETVNPSARFLLAKGNTRIIDIVDYLMNDDPSDEEYREELYELKIAVLNFINKENLFEVENQEDMFDYATEEDIDDSYEE